MKKLCLLLFLSLTPLLHAGWFDWFYSSEKPQATQFDCPHHCGGWGTEGMRKVEWQAVLALWELDRVSHACQQIPFPYQAPPLSREDPWYEAFSHRRIEFKMPLETRGVKGCKRCHWLNKYEVVFSCCCKDSSSTPVVGWDIYNCNDSNGNHKGIEFYFFYDFDYIDEVRYYYFEDDESEEIHEYSGFVSFDFLQSLNVFEGNLVDRLIGDFMMDSHRYYNSDIDNHAVIISELRENSDRKKATLIEYEDEEKQRELEGKPTSRWIQDQKIHLNKVISQIDLEIEEVENEKNRNQEEDRKYQNIFSTYIPLMQAKVEAMYQTYDIILDNCIAHHNAPAAYLRKASFDYLSGDDFECIENIKQLFEITPAEMLSDELTAKLEYTKGKSECELALFDEAILTLSTCIEKHPNHQEAYLERAIALFEQGDFHAAIEDFASSGFTGTPIPPSYTDELAFSSGLIKGITLGAAHSSGEFIVSIPSSIVGLSHGLWAFTTDPAEVSHLMYYACRDAIEFIKEQKIEGTLHSIFPELKTLVEKGDQLSYMEQGELFGTVVGRFGIDFLILKGVGKGVKAFRDLRKANAILSLRRMSTSLEAQQALISCHQKWWKKTAPIIEELKATKGTGLSKELSKAFKNHPLSEHQVRQVLHHAGFKTFPKPKGLSRDWTTSISNKNGGMKYVYSKNNQFQVRVMPGNPASQWPSQRQPYVIHKTDQGFLGKNGKIYTSNQNTEIHIPLKEYDFNKYSRMVPHHD